MRRASFTPPVVLAGVLLLTACGSQTADSQNDGLTQRQRSDSPNSPDRSSCGAQASDTPTAPSTSALPGNPAGLEKGGVKITGSSGGARACAEFDVTNHGTEPFTYMITFEFLSDSGEALTNTKQTVPSVKPGRTVKRTVVMSGLPSHPRGAARVRIAEVRSVPAGEAPSDKGTCPPSGVRVYADDGDAAMGLRVVSLHLENCGARTHRLNGYPQLQLLDERHKPVDSVKILHGGSAIATGTGADGAPQQLDLKPGERAYAGLVWRNTVGGGAGDPVNAPYVRVWEKPGAAPVMVSPELDLGTTGKLGVGPWKKDETNGPVTGGGPGAQSPEPSFPPTAPARP
ncbi:lipoprotein [Streptomyces netropsis]|nr:lipoprotein [Streptomyces netropsis]